MKKQKDKKKKIIRKTKEDLYDLDDKEYFEYWAEKVAATDYTGININEEVERWWD